MAASLQDVCSLFIHIYSASFNRMYFLVSLTRCHLGIGCCAYVPLFFIDRSTRRQTELQLQGSQPFCLSHPTVAWLVSNVYTVQTFVGPPKKETMNV